jgi:hypothetical protein
MTNQERVALLRPRNLRQPLLFTRITGPRGQHRHDRAPLGVREARPLRNLIQRAIATNTDARVGINCADFYARGFDGLKRGAHCGIIAAIHAG